MKILHCSDIHLGRRPVGGLGEYSSKRFADYFTAFDQTIDIAFNNAIEVMVISGDLFDRRELSPEVLERTENLLKQLKNKEIRVLITEGNHDNINRDKESESWIVYLINKGYLERPFYTVEEENYDFKPLTIDDVNFYGLGYPGGMINETMAALATHLENSKDQKNYIIVHTAISGNDDFLPGTIKKETVDLFAGKAIYIAGGHFHSFDSYPKENPYFFLPGSTEYWDIAENKQKKGVIVFDSDTLEHTFHPTSPRTILNVTMEIESSAPEEFKEEFSRKAKELTITADEDIVAIELKPQKAFYIDINYCEDLLVGLGALKAVVKVKYPGDRQQKNITEHISGVEEIEKELIGTWKEFSARPEDTAKALSSLKTHQLENNSAQFLEVFDDMLERMLESNDQIKISNEQN